MTDHATAPTAPIANDAAVAAPRRSYLATVIKDTLAKSSAKLGVFWIGCIAFAAVFAPFLANSHPYLMRTADGRWSSPLLAHLTAPDLILVGLTAVTAVVFALKNLSAAQRLITLLAAAALLIPLSVTLIEPPLTVVYDRYRSMTADGEIQWALYAPIPFSPTDRMRDQPENRLNEPGATHWLGTEENGADLMSRMIHACRIALAVGFIATGIALFIGVTVGGVMGYFSGIVDLLGMRVVEIFSAIPVFFLLLTFVAFFDRNLYLMMVIIGVTSWVGYARFIRAEFLKLRQQDFVQAAIACGLPLRSILFRHMLPNGVSPVLVEASFGVAAAILYESTLSFLGLGLVDEPSWGQMLSQAISPAGGFTWWIAIFPGLAIFLTVFAYNLVGESLRDAIDPHLKKAPT